jgi:hypothetical protein
MTAARRREASDSAEAYGDGLLAAMDCYGIR